jgi:hypothetical protein
MRQKSGPSKDPADRLVRASGAKPASTSQLKRRSRSFWPAPCAALTTAISAPIGEVGATTGSRISCDALLDHLLFECWNWHVAVERLCCDRDGRCSNCNREDNRTGDCSHPIHHPGYQSNVGAPASTTVKLLIRNRFATRWQCSTGLLPGVAGPDHTGALSEHENRRVSEGSWLNPALGSRPKEV